MGCAASLPERTEEGSWSWPLAKPGGREKLELLCSPSLFCLLIPSHLVSGSSSLVPSLDQECQAITEAHPNKNSTRNRGRNNKLHCWQLPSSAPPPLRTVEKVLKSRFHCAIISTHDEILCYLSCCFLTRNFALAMKKYCDKARKTVVFCFISLSLKILRTNIHICNCKSATQFHSL